MSLQHSMEAVSNISIEDCDQGTDLDHERLIFDNNHFIRVEQQKKSLMDMMKDENKSMHSPNHKRKHIEFHDAAKATHRLNLIGADHQLYNTNKTIASMPCTPMINIDSAIKKKQVLSYREDFPKKRQRYRRRNSIVVRRSDQIGPTALAEKCLAAVRCLGEQEITGNKTTHGRVEMSAMEKMRQQTKEGLDEEINFEQENVSRSDLEDKQWYNRLSSLSFDQPSHFETR